MRSTDVLLLQKSKLVKNFENAVLGTQTITEVKGETTDKDPSNIPDQIHLGTETFTKSKGETSDRDR